MERQRITDILMYVLIEKPRVSVVDYPTSERTNGRQRTYNNPTFRSMLRMNRLIAQMETDGKAKVRALHAVPMGYRVTIRETRWTQ